MKCEYNIDELSSGMMVSKKAINKINKLIRKQGIIKIKDHKFKLIKQIDFKQLKRGTLFAIYYNDFNQGFGIYEFLGYSCDDEKYSSIPFFGTFTDVQHYYKINSLQELERLQKKNEQGYETCMIVKDLEKKILNKNEYNYVGGWFYIYGGEWCRGSGAERITFFLVENLN